MKKSILLSFFFLVSLSAFAQKIEGNYCEMVEVSLLGKTYFTIYQSDKMDALLDDKGEKVSTKLGVVKALNIMSERGWEVVSVYISEKAGTKMNTFLFRKK